MKKVLFIFTGIAFFLISTAKAQINPTITSDIAVIKSTLQGQGVIISNLVISGSAGNLNAIGTFTGGNSNSSQPNVGIASGLIISTGDALNGIIGPNNSSGYSSGDGTYDFDNDLDQITTFSKYDLKIITFDIVSTSNILNGKLVFGSEEYPEYVGSGFNDALAVIIDGPGIVSNGAYSDLDGNAATGSRNLSVLSVGGPLSINDINAGVPGYSGNGTSINSTNGAFYIRNYTAGNDDTKSGNEGADATTFNNLQMDAFTVPLSFKVQVIPGATYKIKIVIADVGDSQYDSAVFLDSLNSISNSRDYGDLPAEFDNNSRFLVTDNIQPNGGLVLQEAASHKQNIGNQLFLGNLPPDYESNGNPSANSLGDGADEGGISFSALNTASTSLTATIPYVNTTGAPANICGWVDWNKDNNFDATEGVCTTVSASGTTTLIFTNGLPLGCGATGNIYFARFRISSDIMNTSDFSGEHSNGEVEDYQVNNSPLQGTLGSLILGNDTTLCPGDLLILTSPLANSYQWSTGANTQSISVSTTGKYWVTITNGACISSDTINVTFNIPSVNLGNDKTLCQGQVLVLNAGNASSYQWSTGETSQTISISAAGQYWVKIFNGTCFKADTINISYISLPNIYLGTDTILCPGETLVLTAGIATSYQWSTGATTPVINVSTPGQYWVKAFNGSCFKADTINVSYASSSNLNLGKDTTLCQGETLVLNAGNANSYQWSTGATTQSINVSTTGQYWVQTLNGKCLSNDTISAIFTPIPSYLFKQDTTLCNEQMLVLNAGNANSYQWSTGETSQMITITQSGNYWVNVNYYNLCQKKYSTIVTFEYCDCVLYVPNVFTPTSDGLNDIFKPAYKKGCQFLNFSIYNRWGQKVFETTNLDKGWNGKLNGIYQNTGVFVWQIIALKDGQQKVFKGTVLLIK